MDDTSLGQRIKQERQKRKISLREFARKLGISAAYLVDIEKNRRLPNEETLQKIADLLDVPVSTFDEFSPDVPKPVKEWINGNPILSRILSLIKKAPSPEKTLDDLEKSLSPYTKTKRFISIYESELQVIALESSSWTLETGGDLFGIWGEIPLVYLATKSGPKAIRNQAHFRLDVDYLIKLSNELSNDWGLRYFGDWHSHHRLGLETPSSGNQARIGRIASKNNFSEMAEFIITFSSSYEKDRKIQIHPYVYTELHSRNFSETALIILKGLSPVREALIASESLPEQQLISFSSFPIEHVIVPKEPLGRVPGTEGLPIEQISTKVIEKAVRQIEDEVGKKIELHTTSFGYIIVIPVENNKNIAFAVDKKWPHMVLQVNWIDRISGETEEIPTDIKSASLINLKEVKNIFSQAAELGEKIRS